MSKQIISFAALIVILAGCANDRLKTMDDDFGNAVRQNIAVQTVNPAAGGPDGSDTLDGQRAQQAVDRMRVRSPDAQNADLIQNVGN